MPKAMKATAANGGNSTTRYGSAASGMRASEDGSDLPRCPQTTMHNANYQTASSSRMDATTTMAPHIPQWNPAMDAIKDLDGSPEEAEH